MADFNDFWENLIKGLEDLARKDLSDFQETAEKDGKAFLYRTKRDLQLWTDLMARGELKQEYFEWLVRGKKELAEMESLEQAGLSFDKIKKFKDTIISLIIDTAYETFL
jgi:hypothetical protein